MKTAIKKCECNRGAGAAYQDATHGPGMRVMNFAPGNNHPVWRCTVCAREYPAKEE